VQLAPDIRDYIEAQALRVPFAELERACTAMSAHYRGLGNTAGLNLPAAVKTAAYLVTRFPATHAAAHSVLNEIKHRLGDVEITSLLDLGAGPGCATLAAQGVFPSLKTCSLVESDPVLAGAARDLFPSAAVLARDLRSEADYEAHDLVLASYLLGELSERDRSRVTDRAWRATRVALVIIEPGSTAGFSVVRAARDRLLAAGARMAAPCPAEGPCPIQAPDWCHFAARVERTSLLRRMKHAALGYEDEKFSYVALTRTEVARAQARIIRRPEQRPGLIQLVVCRGASIQGERVTRRKPEAFRSARKAKWGDEWA